MIYKIISNHLFQTCNIHTCNHSHKEKCIEEIDDEECLQLSKKHRPKLENIGLSKKISNIR